MFGTNRAGNLDPSDIGVANTMFLKNATLIDKWNKEGLINSKIDYSTAQERLPEGAGRLLDHRPVGRRTRPEGRGQVPGHPGAEDRVPRRCRSSASRLHGHEVRGDARRRARCAGPGRELHGRRRPRRRSSPLPTAATRRTRSRGKSVNDPRPRAVRARPARAACRCRTSRRWAASGTTSAGRGSSRRRASGAMPAARLLQGRSPRDRRQDRLAPTVSDGAGVPSAVAPAPSLSPSSRERRPPPVAGPPVFRPVVIPRGIALFSGTVGFALKIALLVASRTRSRLGGVRADRSQQVDRRSPCCSRRPR